MASGQIDDEDVDLEAVMAHQYDVDMEEFGREEIVPSHNFTI